MTTENFITNIKDMIIFVLTKDRRELEIRIRWEQKPFNMYLVKEDIMHIMLTK